VLRRTFGPERQEVGEDWRRLHSEELHNLFASIDFVRVITPGRIRRVRHVARMRDECGQNCGPKSRREETTQKT